MYTYVDICTLWCIVWNNISVHFTSTTSFPVNSDRVTGRQQGKITSKSVVASAGVTALWLAMASCVARGYVGYARKGWNCQPEQQSFCWYQMRWVKMQKIKCHIQSLHIRQMNATKSYLQLSQIFHAPFQADGSKYPHRPEPCCR